jgi:drug/metabolite transporter (DMT)-like permease
LSPSPSRLQIVAALAAVYVVWGSTYLAIRVAVETLPPFLMAGTRFLLSGAILYAWVGAWDKPRPSRVMWRWGAVVGAVLLLGGNGLVAWAEQKVPSGITALMISVTPIWMTLMDWARPKGVRPSAAGVLGLALGLAGVALLIGPENLRAGGRMDMPGTAALILATLSWAGGSLYARHAALPASPLLATRMEMLCGGALLTAAGLLLGEGGRVGGTQVSLPSVAAYFYLIFVGSLVGFSAYVWLLKHVRLSLASSYAYVNPVVAVFLGWLLLREPITVRTLGAAVVIVVSVVLLTAKPATEMGNEEMGE